jgi:ubiquinone/menaquinone biosynthesis C-methylase UbiE
MDKSEKFWDKMATSYDREEESAIPTINKYIEKGKKYLKITDRVLDLGCGTGKVSIEVSNSVKEIQAIDISSKMIEIAKKKVNDRNLTNITFFQTTIFDDRFTEENFDVIFGFYVLHLLEEINTAIQRINEILRPGGYLISVTPCMKEKKKISGIFLSLLSKIRLVPKIKLFKFSDLENLLKEGNFKIEETYTFEKNSPEYLVIAKKT